MEKDQIKGHVFNPYRFAERKPTVEQQIDFLKVQGFPPTWDLHQLKLAWAFQGLLGKPINSFEQDAQYFVYTYEPYLTDSSDALETVLTRPMELVDTNYDPNIKGHWAIVDLKNARCTFSEREKSLFLKFGHSSTDKTKIIINLDKALDIAGNSAGFNFRTITQSNGKTDIFYTLCQTFEIPDVALDYYPRNALGHVFSNDGQLCEPVKEWLDCWVEDECLQIHLSCFMEQKRGRRDRQDVHLVSHYLNHWKSHLECGDAFPYGLEALHLLKGAICLLGWEWEHGDIIESRALVQVKKS